MEVVVWRMSKRLGMEVRDVGRILKKLYTTQRGSYMPLWHCQQIMKDIKKTKTINVMTGVVTFERDIWWY